MTRHYVGCHSAAEAEGKVECWNSYLGVYDQVIFFANEEDMMDYLATQKRGDAIGYYKPILNWESGRKGNWEVVKSNWD